LAALSALARKRLKSHVFQTFTTETTHYFLQKTSAGEGPTHRSWLFAVCTPALGEYDFFACFKACLTSLKIFLSIMRDVDMLWVMGL